MRKRVTASVWLFVVLLFLYAPILVLAVYSFTEATMIGQVRGFSLQNYVTLFTNEDLVSIITGTFGLALIVSTARSVIAWLMIWRTKFRL